MSPSQYSGHGGNGTARSHGPSRRNTHRLSDFTLRAFTTLETTEITNILCGRNWLASLISASEGLPIGQ